MLLTLGPFLYMGDASKVSFKWYLFGFNANLGRVNVHSVTGVQLCVVLSLSHMTCVKGVVADKCMPTHTSLFMVHWFCCLALDIHTRCIH